MQKWSYLCLLFLWHVGVEKLFLIKKRLRIVKQRQISQQLAHFFILNEWRLSHHLIGDARTLKGFDQQSALGAQAIKYGKIGKRTDKRIGAQYTPGIEREITGAANHLLNLMDHIFCFGFVRRRSMNVEL